MRPRPLAGVGPRIGLFLTPEQSALLAYAIERACAMPTIALDRARLGVLEQVAVQLARAAKEAKEVPV